MPFRDVLFNMSYNNVIMYGAVIPSFRKGYEGKKKEQEEEVIKVDDPKNRQRVIELINQMV